MSAVLIPTEATHFAIYAISSREKQGYGQPIWDLHATSTDKRTALEHARLLVLQPHVREVQVKQVLENTQSGVCKVREVRRLRKKNETSQRVATVFCGVVLMGMGLIYALV